MEFSKFRDLLAPLIGRRLVDVTQEEDGEESPFICLMFEDGSMLTFPLGDDPTFFMEGPVTAPFEKEEE